MDIQVSSFILGICSVLVTAMAVVSVYAIVKVMKLSKQVYDNGVWALTEFENVKKAFETKEMELEHKIGIVYRDMDSRNDKLYERIMKNNKPLVPSEMVEAMEKEEFKNKFLQLLNNEDEGNDLKNRILHLMNK